MFIYIGNDLEDRLKALEVENASLRKYNEYHQVVHEIDHMSDLHVDSSFHKQSIKLDNYLKIEEWFDSSLGQSTVIQQLDLKRPILSNPNQTQNKRRYVNFENGSHFICSLNLNSPDTTVCIVFKMTNIASGDQLFVNSLIANSDEMANSKFITFFRTYSGLRLLISKAQSGSYVTIANDDSSSIKPDLKFPSSKSNCTILNKWHVISVTWSKGENLSNCWSNGVKLITFTIGNVKGTDPCHIGNYIVIPHSKFSSILSRWFKTHLTGCIGEIIGFYRSLTDKETSDIHKYWMKKWGVIDDPI